MKPATGLALLFLKLTGAWAVTTPWQVIYCRQEHLGNAQLLAHEQIHLAQIKRDGALMWTLKVFWYLLRYGYKASPYEIEARNSAGM